MQSLQLNTEHLAPSLQGPTDFSVLPSPSTFFGGGASLYSGLSAYLPSPSTAAFDYQATFHDYAAPVLTSSESSASTPEPSWPGSQSDRASSPATSHHSTPRGTPVLDKAVVVGEMYAAASPYDGVMAADPVFESEHPFSFEPKPIRDHAPSSQHSVLSTSVMPASSFLHDPLSHSVDGLDKLSAHNDEELLRAAMFAFAPSVAAVPMPPAQLQETGPVGPAPAQHFDLPSPAASNASYGGPGQYHVEHTPSPYQQHAYIPHSQPSAPLAYHEAGAGAGFTASQFAAAVSNPASLVGQQYHFQAQTGPLSQLPQQQQNFVPMQFTAMNGATYAVAVPVSSPAPAAIETPHGTYYFVPNASAAPAASNAVAAAVASSPAPAMLHANTVPATPFAGVRPPPPAVQSKAHHRQPSAPSPAPCALSVQAPIVVPAASPDEEPSFVLPTGATVPASALPVAMGTQQKIRLPVGQGKKGSTKRRPAKKEQVRRFTCPHPGCGRAFARNFNMASHYKSHLGVREFKCPVCPKMFSRRHDRARHCAAVHDEHIDREGNPAANGSCGLTSTSASASASQAGDDDDDEDHLLEDHDDEFDFDIGVDVSGSG